MERQSQVPTGTSEGCAELPGDRAGSRGNSGEGKEGSPTPSTSKSGHHEVEHILSCQRNYFHVLQVAKETAKQETSRFATPNSATKDQASTMEVHEESTAKVVHLPVILQKLLQVPVLGLFLVMVITVVSLPVIAVLGLALLVWYALFIPVSMLKGSVGGDTDPEGEKLNTKRSSSGEKLTGLQEIVCQITQPTSEPEPQPDHRVELPKANLVAADKARGVGSIGKGKEALMAELIKSISVDSSTVSPQSHSRGVQGVREAQERGKKADTPSRSELCRASSDIGKGLVSYNDGLFKPCPMAGEKARRDTDPSIPSERDMERQSQVPTGTSKGCAELPVSYNYGLFKPCPMAGEEARRVYDSSMPSLFSTYNGRHKTSHPAAQSLYRTHSGQTQTTEFSAMTRQNLWSTYTPTQSIKLFHTVDTSAANNVEFDLGEDISKKLYRKPDPFFEKTIAKIVSKKKATPVDQLSETVRL